MADSSVAAPGPFSDIESERDRLIIDGRSSTRSGRSLHAKADVQRTKLEALNGGSKPLRAV